MAAMSKQKKILLGISTIVPILAIMLIFVLFFSLFFSTFYAFDDQQQIDDISPTIVQTGIMSYVLAILMIAGLSIFHLVYFLIHVVNNKMVDSNERLIWILVFLLAGTIGFPVYWYMRIWKEPEVLPLATDY
ncbi:MAG: hypothetical protein AAFX87_20740 [Bacteroidota bacterium]